MYIYHTPSGSKQRVTIVGQKRENKLYLSVAKCHENDSFNRKKGVLIASSRLAKGKYNHIVDVTDSFTGKQFLAIATELEAQALLPLPLEVISEK